MQSTIHSIKKWLQTRHFSQVYRYKRDIYDAISPADKTQIIIRTINKTFLKKRTVLFYPDMPKKLFVIYKILLFLGYKITADPSINADIAIKWRNSMDGNPFLPPEPILENIALNSPSLTLINMHCNDVTKSHVGKIFKDVFGYSLSVDPEKYKGKCVMKLNWNGLHIGTILECPVDKLTDEFVYQKLINDENSKLDKNQIQAMDKLTDDLVYQKLINNETGNGLVEDIRVPVFRNIVPFVYLKYRSTNQRLIDRSHSNKKVVMAKVEDVLSQTDIKNILNFCHRMGLDYGEVDVLRNREDNKIYIVDVNNNPAGPPEPISQADSNTAIIRLAQAFEKAFID